MLFFSCVLIMLIISYNFIILLYYLCCRSTWISISSCSSFFVCGQVLLCGNYHNISHICVFLAVSPKLAVEFLMPYRSAMQSLNIFSMLLLRQLAWMCKGLFTCVDDINFHEYFGSKGAGVHCTGPHLWKLVLVGHFLNSYLGRTKKFFSLI